MKAVDPTTTTNPFSAPLRLLILLICLLGLVTLFVALTILIPTATFVWPGISIQAALTWQLATWILLLLVVAPLFKTRHDKYEQMRNATYFLFVATLALLALLSIHMLDDSLTLYTAHHWAQKWLRFVALTTTAPIAMLFYLITPCYTYLPYDTVDQTETGNKVLFPQPYP